MNEHAKLAWETVIVNPSTDAPRSVVQRVALVMSALMDVGTDGQTGSVLARRSGLPVPTVHRLLAEMAASGLAMQDPSTKKWTLGPLALGVGSAARKQLSLIDVVHPHLQHLVESTQETAVLTLRDGKHATYVDFVEGPQRLTLREHVGMRLPLTVGASRQAILSTLAENEATSLLDDLESDERSPDIPELRSQLVVFREQGFVLTRGAITTGASGIAAPILRPDGTANASLMLAVPDVRLPDSAVDDLASIVREHAATIARDIRAARLW